jgi:hypothetical protein
MALPRQLPTTYDGGSVPKVGPFISSGGAAYYVAKPDGTVYEVEVLKSSNPSTTAFTAQDTSNNPDQSNGYISGGIGPDDLDAYQVGDILHIAALSHTAPAMGDWTWYWDYFSFDMSDDTWDTTTITSTVDSHLVDSSLTTGQIRISVRGFDNDIVIVGKGPDQPDMGNPFDTIYIAYYDGTDWDDTNSKTRVDTAEAGRHYRDPQLSNDYTTDGDYTVTWDEEGQSIDGRAVTGASHTQQSAATIVTGLAYNQNYMRANIVYNDGGTWRGTRADNHSSSNYIQAYRYDPTSDTPFTSDTIEGDITGADNPLDQMGLLCYDSATDTRYLIYVVDGTPDTIKYVSSVNEATWGDITSHSTPANVTQLIFGKAVVAASPVDGGDVIAFLYFDGSAGTAYYDEISLGAAGETATPTAGSLALTGGTAIATWTVSVTPLAGALALTGAAPLQGQNWVATPLGASLVLTGGAVTVGQALVVLPTSGSLALTGGTPSVAATAHVWTTPTGGALSLAGSTPAVSLSYVLTPTAASLVLTGGTALASLELVATPLAASLVLTSGLAIAGQSLVVTPTAGSLVLTGATPTVAVAADTVVTPLAGSLTLTGGQGSARRFWGWDGITPAPDSVLTLVNIPTGSGGIFSTGTGGEYVVTDLVFNWFETGHTGTANVRFALYKNTSLTMDGAELVQDFGKYLTPDFGIWRIALSAPYPVVTDGDYLFLVGKTDESQTRYVYYTTGTDRGNIQERYRDNTTESADPDDPWDDPAPNTYVDHNSAVAVGFHYRPATTVTPTSGSLTLSGGTPSVSQTTDTVVTPTSGALALTGATPLVGQNVVATPLAAALVLTGATPLVGENKAALPTSGSLSLASGTPLVGQDYVLTPSSGALSLTGAVPTVSTTASVVVTPTGGSLSLSGGLAVASLELVTTPLAAALTLVAGTPSVAQELVATPLAASLSLTGVTPTLAVDREITPTGGSLSLAGGAAIAVHARYVTPLAASLTLTGATPTVTVPTGTEAVPTAGALSLAGATPSVQLGYVVTPLGASLTLVAGLATVATGQKVTPTGASLVLTGGVSHMASGPALGVSLTVQRLVLAQTLDTERLVMAQSLTTQRLALAQTLDVQRLVLS